LSALKFTKLFRTILTAAAIYAAFCIHAQASFLIPREGNETCGDRINMVVKRI